MLSHNIYPSMRYIKIILWSNTHFAHSIRLWLETQRYWVRIPVGSDVCHQSCVSIYTVLQTVRKPGVCSAVYGTVHYEEPLKSFDNSSIGHSGDFKKNKALNCAFWCNLEHLGKCRGWRFTDTKSPGYVLIAQKAKAARNVHISWFGLPFVKHVQGDAAATMVH